MTHHPPDAEEQRAREWMNRLRDEYTNRHGSQRTAVEYNDKNIASLALLLKRVAIEAKEKEAFECMALFRGERDINNVYILIHDRARRSRAQLTALNEDKQDSPR